MSEEKQPLYHVSIKQSAKGLYYLGSCSVNANVLSQLRDELEGAVKIAVETIDTLNKQE